MIPECDYRRLGKMLLRESGIQVLVVRSLSIERGLIHAAQPLSPGTPPSVGANSTARTIE